MNLNPRTHRGRFNLTRPISEAVLLLFGFGMRLVNSYYFLTDKKVVPYLLGLALLSVAGGKYFCLGVVLSYFGFLGFVLLYVVMFFLLDILYNWTVGAFIFWERPFPEGVPWKTMLFTDRLEEHKWNQGRNQSPESREMALYMCGRLDYYDPGHCA